jgi:hypothetical protein
MSLPRPASPRALFADLRAFFGSQRRAHWLAVFFALSITSGIIFAFYLDSQSMADDRETVIFLDSWPASRTDAEIRADQQRDEVERNRAELEHRRHLQELERTLNRYGI